MSKRYKPALRRPGGMPADTAGRYVITGEIISSEILYDEALWGGPG